MAGIYKRKNPSGTYRYRVQLRRKGFQSFYYSFSTAKEAIKWVEDHEEKYYIDPVKYHIWAEQTKKKARLKRLLDD